LANLRLHKVEKNYGKGAILTEVSFSLRTGQILGIFGRNGSGKSTLLKILFGTVRADALDFEINGTPVANSKLFATRHLAYVPQHPFLPSSLRVRDVIPIYAASERAQDAIFYNPLVAKITAKRIGALSHGERKYFETILIANGPHPFLLLDEPFSMLDPLQIADLKLFLDTLKQEKGIILTDHYFEEVLQISDMALVLKQGKSFQITSEEDLGNFEYLRKRE
tara:strand:+ start:327 stop:995 length:669 start_codon:yes stop_codon:yes gene_type:complete